MSHIIRLTDRSRTTTDWQCRRSRFYLTEFAGKGIVRATSTLELDFGTDEHDALEELARRVGEADVVGDLAPRLFKRVFEREVDREGEVRATELASIAEGSFRGFCKVVWPSILQLYDIVAVEVECLKTLSPWLKFMARPDLILRSKVTGQHVYMEYKTTSWMDARWINSWQKAVQTHSGCMAAEETLGVPVEVCVVQGIYKGYQKEGHFRSVYSEGWRHLGGLNVTYSPVYMRTKGWEKFSPSTLPGGVAQWVNEQIPLDLLESQFPRTPPIYMRRDLCDNFFRDLVEREDAILHGIEELKRQETQEGANRVLSHYFPQNFEKCTPSFGGRDCTYLECCWNGVVGADPLASGLYKERVPHHSPEIELLKE